jgi:Mycothiol maleylpyruvate isomerase N-terminal domain
MSNGTTAPRPARFDVLSSYDDGVAAIAQHSSHVVDWSARTPCAEWTANDLAGHLLSIVRYYHRLLDASLAGTPITGLPRGRDLADMNSADLGRLDDSTGTERISLFVSSAGAYGTRLAEIGDPGWWLTLGIWEGLGPLTVGQHAGIAIGEWHVHAWDLARVSGRDHHPADAPVVAQGQKVVGRVIEVQGDPWDLVLTGYGRIGARADE